MNERNIMIEFKNAIKRVDTVFFVSTLIYNLYFNNYKFLPLISRKRIEIIAMIINMWIKYPKLKTKNPIAQQIIRMTAIV